MSGTGISGVAYRYYPGAPDDINTGTRGSANDVLMVNKVPQDMTVHLSKCPLNGLTLIIV